MRNAVDHGLETSEQRRARGKNERGRIELAAHRSADAFVVRISDDGAGIDWQRLADKATQLGLPVATEHDLTEALFSDGVSACDHAGEISGRGVGMAAVRAEVGRRGGTIRVSSKPGNGTTIEIEFPAAFEAASEHAVHQPAGSNHETSPRKSAHS